mgnify:CR=1 FL=1
MKHKHAELIKAWADGAGIEGFNPEYQKWIPSPNPGWFPDIEYRIKPTDQTNSTKQYLYVYKNDPAGKVWVDTFSPTEKDLPTNWEYLGKVEAEK